MKQNNNTRYMVQLALLIALELVMAYTPLGYLHIFALEITFLTVPMAIGAILLGPAAGAVLGGVFGLTSFATCFGSSPFGSALLAINPLYTFIGCFVTRVLAGWCCGLIFAALHRLDKKDGWSFGAASLAGPLLNTFFFMGALVLFFYQTDYIQSFAAALGAANPFVFVIAFVGVQGLVEALACFLLSGVISRAVYGYLSRDNRRDA